MWVCAVCVVCVVVVVLLLLCFCVVGVLLVCLVVLFVVCRPHSQDHSKHIHIAVHVGVTLLLIFLEKNQV